MPGALRKLPSEVPSTTSTAHSLMMAGQRRFTGENPLALRKLPEAELAKGVSIDDYSTYRATRFAEPV